MKKRILIVGSGVLGAYLSEIFLKKFYEVYVGTRYLRKNYKNYKYLKIEKKIKFFRLNFLDKKEVENTITKLKPEAVYYFAGQSSIYKSLKNPKSTLDSNFHGAKIFLNVIHKNRLNTKFFKANSGYIFKTLKFKKNLKYQFLKPNNPYIDAQVKAFKVVEKFRRLGVNCYSLIFFNIESPLKNKSFILNKVNDFIKTKKTNFLKVGDIEVVRDFSWAPEIMKGVFYSLNLKPQNIIFASGKDFYLREMIKYFFDLKKLNFRRFIKIDKSLFRKKEKKKVTVSKFQTHNLLKNFKWQPKIYGKKLVKKLYHSK
jgi:GDPmannose 4,6-dehydratase